MSSLLSFVDYLSTEEQAQFRALPSTWILSALEQSPQLSSLLGEETKGIPIETLTQIALRYRDYLDWKQACEKSELPTELLCRTRMLAEIESLVEAKDTKVSLNAMLSWWQACRAIAEKDGELLAEPEVNRADTRLLHYQDHLTSCKISELAGHRWFAWKRGVRAGLLSLSLRISQEVLDEQRALHPELPKQKWFFRDELLPALQGQVIAAIQHRAENEALQSAALVYQGLIASPALPSESVVSIYVGGARQPIGAVFLKRNELVESRRFATEHLDAVIRWLSECKASAVVLPIGATASEILATIQRQLPEGAVHVSTVGLHASREQLSEQEKRLPNEIGMALLLARRALFPVKTWTQGDPVSLGLAEYQQEIDEDRLRSRLLDAKSAALHKLSQEGVGMARVVLANGGRPNPLVHSIDDIRPGMSLNAVITSIAPFGAFANIGLSEEGLIHLSELSDNYVKDAASVVRIGQEVRARVLSVERDRRRIQLSLKTGEKQSGQRRGKNIALSNLDALFSGKKSSS